MKTTNNDCGVPVCNSNLPAIKFLCFIYSLLPTNTGPWVFALCANLDFFLPITFSLVKISLHVEFHPPGLPRSGRFMVGDNKKQKKQNKKFHEINGFLSLQLGLSFELGLRLRLTNKWSGYVPHVVKRLSDLFGNSTHKKHIHKVCMVSNNFVQFQYLKLSKGCPLFTTQQICLNSLLFLS